MILFAVVLAVHVIVAVVGTGLVGAIPLVASSARSFDVSVSPRASALDTLLRLTRWSLVTMLVSGALLDFASGGAFHAAGWFRASFGLLLFVGFSHSRARVALREGRAAPADPGVADVSFRKVERWGWTMCAAVALIAGLMAVKPLP